ncbi:diamine oxidase [copper-containing]-like [Petromyzon marinus]|uniref:Amine oxidase n=1 Tax=Petromyzon marinus TaxID=7757 RepID=A0AAJ7WLW4_PETMA|nr:amiloride-sensitive amine oxidase [copper-containing]-like [Petromyzon marinus]XP_032802282.1 amiloride-sensitive amine oxidase [copper-containing]-like [Petromyzon marinus]
MSEMNSASRKWVFLTLLFVSISIILATVLIHQHVNANFPKKCPNKFVLNGIKPDYKAIEIFSDLTPTELTTVKDFLVSDKNLNIVASEATVNSNYIYMIELYNPDKKEALNYLDHGGAKPARVAKAVVFRGADVQPSIAEYLIGPLPNPTWYRPHSPSTRKRVINFSSRPTTIPEYTALYTHFLPKALEKVNHILEESYGYTYHNCTKKCLTVGEVAPKGLKSGERRSWVMLLRQLEGFYLHPVGFHVLVNHESSNTAKWAVEKVYYHGQYFISIEELITKYDKGSITKIKLSDSSRESSGYNRRGAFRADTSQTGPRQYEPEGHRYRVDGNFVQYMPWTFAFRISYMGLQIFDIKYNGERIVYEMGLQDVVSYYTGNDPIGSLFRAMDSGWHFGADNFELVKGIDCPHTATYLDTYHFVNSDKPLKYPNSICIFEHNTGVPLRRHLEDEHRRGYSFYGGLVNYVLVIRSVNTVYNYDYVVDYIFYQNGVIEAKIHPTGYLVATYFLGHGLKYGNKIFDHVLGNVHTHMINYKLDMDIVGTSNSFKTVNLQLENTTVVWSPEHAKVMPTVKHDLKKTESEAAFKFDVRLPYLVFVNENARNKWGAQRGYRVQLTSHGNPLLPEDYEEEKSVAWSRYQMAVTKRKETELYSGSIYNQHDPWDPAVYFQDFINDNENIVNQDLVAWVTVGFVHIPHSEDVPNTATACNGAGFFFRPFNFYDEDPSVASRDVVILRPGPPGSGETRVSWWTEQSPTEPSVCLPDIQPLTYNGTRGPV